MAKYKLYPHQEESANRAIPIFKKYGFVYLAMEVRCGKTATSMHICKMSGAKKVLFLTKKKAIPSILSDYIDFGFDQWFEIVVINDESMHTITDNDFDIIIHDEHHRCFLGNTLIDGIKIKDIDLGTSIKSFNFTKGIYENKKVVNLYKNPLKEDLVKIKCNGKEIICTKSHKIFTKRGWVEAGNITTDDELQVV